MIWVYNFVLHQPCSPSPRGSTFLKISLCNDANVPLIQPGPPNTKFRQLSNTHLPYRRQELAEASYQIGLSMLAELQ